MEEGYIVPIHKKDEKQNIKNYRPVLLLPICCKIFEILIVLTNCFSISSLLTNSTLTTSLVLNPLIPISTNCYHLPTKFLHLLIMDYKLEVFFLDIHKAFDKIWHEGFIFKFKQNDISGEFFTSYPIF